MGRYNSTVCRPYVGQMVHVQTTKGMHRGVVDNVTSKGLYLRQSAHQASGERLDDFVYATNFQPKLNAETVFYGGGYPSGYGYGGYGGWGYGRFFIPFLTILALTSLLWW